MALSASQLQGGSGPGARGPGVGPVTPGAAHTHDHGLHLTGLGDDDHTQYALLAGRTGTSNNLTISSNGDGTVNGSAASGGALNLNASSHATKGAANVNCSAINIVVPASSTSDQFTLTRSGEAVASYGLRIHKSSATVVTMGIGGLNLIEMDGNAESIVYGQSYGGLYHTNTHRLDGQVIVRGADTWGATFRTALIVRGLSGTTTHLQEWQNSSSTRLASIGKDGWFELAEQSAPSTPSSGFFALYPTSNNLFCKNDSGSTFALTRRIMQITVTDPNGDALTTGDGKAYFRINSELDGYKITAVASQLAGAQSTSGTVDVQIANVTDAVDLLSTKLTIDANEWDSSTAASAAVINTSNNTVNTGDRWRIDIDAAGTGAKGLIVEITLSMP